MKLSDFYYELPQELIAQEPLPDRDDSRLMVISDKTEHKKFCDSVDYLRKDDVLVLNDTKVFPARIFGRKETGGNVEVLLLAKKSVVTWACLYRGKNICQNTKLFFDKEIEGVITGKQDYDVEITFNKKIDDVLGVIGVMPTPPYIKKKLVQRERYNTIFAKKNGSTAAPTAGLHFTKDLLDKISARGVQIVFLTLHVGLGTFLPVKAEEIEKHKMHAEYFKISRQTARIINKRKGRLFVCGTTTLRALESSCDNHGKIWPAKKCTDIFIYPPYTFKLQFDGLITNFHLPKSTLLMLVSAVVGRERILEAYRVAIKEKYRFYSFGDALLVLTNKLLPEPNHRRVMGVVFSTNKKIN